MIGQFRTVTKLTKAARIPRVAAARFSVPGARTPTTQVRDVGSECLRLLPDVRRVVTAAERMEAMSVRHRIVPWTLGWRSDQGGMRNAALRLRESLAFLRRANMRMGLSGLGQVEDRKMDPMTAGILGFAMGAAGVYLITR